MLPRIHVNSFRRHMNFRILGIIALFFFLFILLRSTVIDALVIVFGAAVVCFLVEPIVKLYEKCLNRSIAVPAALITLFATLTLSLLLLLPTLAAEFAELTQALPSSVMIVKGWLDRAILWMEIHLGIQLNAPALSSSQIPEIAKGTIQFAGNIADLLYHFSLMIVLGYFFMCDRERMLIRVELLIPQSMRRTAVRMGKAICRELMVYLRGQAMIAGIVALMTAVGLYLAGVRSALVLGIIVGILNMIPYFGPVIGSIPAVLMALSDGIHTAMIALLVLWIVQQIDSTIISPRIMSNVTGVSPAAVLLSIFIGSALGGIVGMLLAMPSVIAFRTVFRVFVQRYENV